jgi:hypothetical protein
MSTMVATVTQGPSYETLAKALKKQPVHGARSFVMADVRNIRPGKGGRGKDSFTRVTSPLLPKTGIGVVDNLNWRVSEVLRLGKSTLFDLPKAAFKGGLYGGIAGGVLSLATCYYTRNISYLAMAAFTLGGAALGSAARTGQELYSKFRALRAAVLGL